MSKPNQRLFEVEILKSAKVDENKNWVQKKKKFNKQNKQDLKKKKKL